jgi:MoaA/NifB/PqqE/SkfB family radical SAM enzyme
MHSEAWCPMPFLSLTIHPTNKLTSCMMSNTNMGDPYINEGWDNDNFKNLRQNMLAGFWSLERVQSVPTSRGDGVWSIKDMGSSRTTVPHKVGTVSNCSTCLLRELNGLQSQRNNWIDNRKRFYPNIYENANKLVGNDIVYLNLNLSNICNFKCRMCGPTYSNAWIPDYNFLKENNLPNIFTAENDPKQILDFDKLLEVYGKQLSKLQTIWVTGGEPFMDDKLIDFVNALSSYCDISKLDINVTTNGSKIDLNKLSAFEKVGRIGYNLSIDAVGPLFEYMRSAGVFSWDQMEKLIQELIYYKKNHSNIILSYNSSYQIYNSLNIKNFYEYFLPIIGKKDWIEYRLVTSPSWLAVRHATKEIKEVALLDIDKLLNSNLLNNRKEDISFINNCKSMLIKPADQNEWNKFLKFTGGLDGKRNQYLKDYSPEIYNLLTDSDIEILENAAVS